MPERSLNDLFRRIAGARKPLPAHGDPSPWTCSVCGSDAFALAEWRPRGATDWWMQLRCGACGEWREHVLPQADAEALELRLEHGIAAIERDVLVLDLERMEAQANVFAAALARDLVDASDFAR